MSDDEDTFTQRLRRKLWKSEPPGLKDPYNVGAPENTRRVKQVKKEAFTDDLIGKTAVQGGQYVRATTWDGLEQIGGATGWWEEAWDRVNVFEGFVFLGIFSLCECGLADDQICRFMAPSKMESKEDVSVVIHRALVEIHIMREAGLPAAFSASPWKENPYDDPDWGTIGFRHDENGSTVLVFPDEDIRQTVLNYLTNPEETRDDSASATYAAEGDESSGIEEIEGNMDEENQVALDERPTSEEELETSTTDDSESPHDDFAQESVMESPAPLLTDRSWLMVQFDDPALKFTVRIPHIKHLPNPPSLTNILFQILKRVMQLTGIRIPDPAIPDLTSAKTLLGHLIRKPKPKKLADRLLGNEELVGLPNLHIRERRYTPIDREKEIGRWKVIEKELIRRNLPVTGPG